MCSRIDCGKLFQLIYDCDSSVDYPMKNPRFTPFAIACLTIVGLMFAMAADDNEQSPEYRVDLHPVNERYAEDSEETPDFQRHVAPLLGRLGCNARACHGSFQGQGGFQLSLFGYDFDHDYQSLLEEDTGRVDIDSPDDSLIIAKPTDADMHEGGLRYDLGSWEHRLLQRWIQTGAKPQNGQTLERLELIPDSLRMTKPDTPVQIQAIAHWNDGTAEDVTPLTRFESNNPQIASVTEDGVITTNKTPGDTHVVAFYDSAVAPLPVLHPYDSAASLAKSKTPTPTRIDKLVVAKLDELNIRQSKLSDDATFLRRVTLDMTGTLPSPQAIESFLADKSKDKRARKIEQLLDTPAFAAWWTTFFCDLTGNNEKQLQNAGYAPPRMSKQWYDWIYERVNENMPYDELAAGIILGRSRETDESYTEFCERMKESYHSDTSFGADDSMPYYWMRREFQDVDARTISFAHAFMGIRIQCAQCHKHPFDQWTMGDFQEFSRFFSGVSVTRGRNVAKEDRPELATIMKNLGMQVKGKPVGKLVRELGTHLKNGETVPFPELKTHKPKPLRKQGEKLSREDRKKRFKEGRLLGGETIDLSKMADARQPVMDWLREEEHPYFAKALVNRVWAKYFGIGIVEPADDLNLANPPSNAPLLDYLTKSFIESGYDLKQLHREIANSRTYQLSWEPNKSNADDTRNFSHAVPRRLPAEVIYDGIAQAAAKDKDNDQFLTNIEGRAIAIPGTEARRRPRQRQKQNKKVDPTFALSVFGKSERKTSCDCERSSDPTLIQTVYLKNDRDMHQLLRSNDGWIGEVNKSFASVPLTPRQTNRLKNAEKRLKELRQERRVLLKKGDEEGAQQVFYRIRGLSQRLAPAQDRLRAENTEAADQKPLSPEQIVTQAYLRTLSRHPDEQELARCIEHLKSDDDMFSRTADLLWALVNTKEFIVNH